MIYNNNSRPQQRKMFEINHYHNQQSSIDLLWLHSLKDPEPIKDKLLK